MGQFALGKSPQISQLRPWHRSMARAVACGMRPGELAASYGYSEGQISRIIQSPLFEAEVARLVATEEYMVGEVRHDLEIAAQRSMEILDRELSKDEGLSFKERKLQVNTAFGVLDRAGYGKQEQSLHLHQHEHEHVSKMSDEELYKDVIQMVQEEESV